MSWQKKTLMWCLPLILVIPWLITSRLPAGLFAPDARLHVVIDGLDYGPFDTVEGLSPEIDSSLPSSPTGTLWRVTLKRSFVTDPSLYLWARNFTHRRLELKEVQLVGVDQESAAVRKIFLRSCQPVTWTVEAVDSQLGGFHETVELAVQEIERE